jgi:N-formylglutamate amidohydrolase
LNQSNLDLKINTPFKGGYITRSIGQPEQNINAIQLEMSKDLYMKNNESAYDFEKAQIIKKLLEQTFSTIIEKLT